MFVFGRQGMFMVDRQDRLSAPLSSLFHLSVSIYSLVRDPRPTRNACVFPVPSLALPPGLLSPALSLCPSSALPPSARSASCGRAGGRSEAGGAAGAAGAVGRSALIRAQPPDRPAR